MLGHSVVTVNNFNGDVIFSIKNSFVVKAGNESVRYLDSYFPFENTK